MYIVHNEKENNFLRNQNVIYFPLTKQALKMMAQQFPISLQLQSFKVHSDFWACGIPIPQQRFLEHQNLKRD